MTSIQMPQLGETIIEGTILKWLKAEGDTSSATSRCSRSPPTRSTPRSLARRGHRHEDPRRGGGDGPRRDGAGRGRLRRGLGAVGRTRRRSATLPRRPRRRRLAGERRAQRPRRRRQACQRRRRRAAPARPHRPRGARSIRSRCRIGGRGRRSCRRSCGGWRQEHGIDLSQVAGTGTGRAHHEAATCMAVDRVGGAAAAAPAPAAPAASRPSPRPRAVAAARRRRARARGRADVAHPQGDRRAHARLAARPARAWTMVEVNVDHLVQLRERAKDAFLARDGVKLTYLPFVSRATVDALLAFPQVNSRIVGRGRSSRRALREHGHRRQLRRRA